MKIQVLPLRTLLVTAALYLGVGNGHAATMLVDDLVLQQEEVEIAYQQHPLARNPETAMDAPPPRPYVQVGCLRFPVTLSEDGQMLSAMRGTLWTNGEVYYQFDPAVTQTNRGRFVQAAEKWAETANLTFIEGTGVGNYIYVINANGNYSFLGMVGGPQELGMFNWSIEGIIIHEIGHALGLIHEHQRTDRDSYINVLEQNIIPGFENQFSIITGSSSFGDYDFESIMHYPKDAFGLFGNTIEPLPAYSQFLNTMGQRTALSQADKLGMENMYGPLASLRYESHVIDDDNVISSGNGDGIVDPGESIEMPVTVANRDSVTYAPVIVDLSTTDPYITITRDNQTLASVVPQGTSETQAFRFDVDPGCPPGQVVNFQLDMRSGTTTWISTFTIVVSETTIGGGGSLELGTTTIHDGSGGGSGNKNGLINSGESIDLEVSLKNESSTEISNIRSTLTTTSPYVTITDDYEVFSAIDPGGTETTRGDFDFDVAPLTPHGHLIEFQLDVSTSEGDFTYFFSLTVSGLPALSYSSHTIMDGLDRNKGEGNGNQIVEAGEDIDMYITVTNSGLGDSTESRTVLSSTSPWITITDSVERHDGMSPGGTFESPGDYEFLVSPNIPKGTDIPFTLTMTTDEGVYTDTFVVSIPADPVVPTVSRMAPSGGSLQMDWASEDGITYRVWCKARLEDAEWTLLDTVTGTGDQTTFTFPDNSAHAFYRIERVDPASAP